MKYTIESTKDGCIETLELHDGRKYTKRHIRTSVVSRCEDAAFSDQMEDDGMDEDIVNKVYDTFDGFLANDFMDIAKLDY